MTTDVYPGLLGKVAVVAGTQNTALLEVVGAFAANRMPVAVVAPTRNVTTAAAGFFADTNLGVIAVTADPSDSAVWRRLAPHAEQRLGPIDIVVLAGELRMRDLVVGMLLPDMAARTRGVIIELGTARAMREMPTGVHHYLAAAATEVVALAATGSA